MADQVAEFFSNDDGVFNLADLVEQYHKFIPTDAGDRIRLAHVLGQYLGQFLQITVSLCMPNGIVDQFESVQVDEE